jgi:hypothetical protein
MMLLPGAVMLTACEETIELDSRQAPPQLVVQSTITNQLKAHPVTLSKTAGFYSSGQTPRVTDAVVSISDNENNVFDYFYNSEAGKYFPNQPFEGIPGRTYTLNIQADGKTITAMETMPTAPVIDKIQQQIDEEEQEDPEDEGYFYEITINATEPQDTRDYYLFKFYRNDSIQDADGRAIYFADDNLIGEQINGIEAPVYYKVGDEAKFEIYSITRQAFVFYNDLNNILNSDGGMFSPQPANPRTNLQGGAIGFFQVSPLAADSLVITP